MSVETFIRVAGREMAVGEVEFTLCPYQPNEVDDFDEEVGGGVPPHSLTLFVEPTDDQAGYLQATDIELRVQGELPAALDGLRIKHSLDSGDFGPVTLPWIRPGSAVGMAGVGFNPASTREANNGYDKDLRCLHGELELFIDRMDDLWRIEIRTGYEPAGELFHAVFLAPLSVEE